MIGWYFSLSGVQESYALCYFPGIGIRAWSQQLGAWTVVFIPVTGAAWAAMVPNGFQVYTAFCDSTGHNSTHQGHVYDESKGADDTLFASPLPTTIATVSTSQPNAGVVTQGTHRLGYIFTTRNGYTGALNPVTAGGVFAPVTFTAADSSHNLQVTLNFLSVPAYLNPGTIQIVMTTASNLDKYYTVPGAKQGVVAGAVVVTLDINDSDLAATGTDVTQNQNLLTAINGSGPFNPYSLFPYSSRMSYVTQDSSGFPVIYFSDQNNYQSITAAFHAIYIDGRQIPIHGASLGGMCYIATLGALYGVQDNGGQPVSWTPPQRVDGSVGILAPSCMLAGGGKILIASEKGFFIYRGGTFPVVPVSYWNASDWNRINWAAATQVQIVDDAFQRVLRVIAPLNVVVIGATNTNPITITTAVLINNVPVAYPHLFPNGISVTISGVSGNTAANTTAIITVTGANTFTIPVAGNGDYISGGVAKPATPNAVMSWAYPEGDAPGSPYYSLDGFASFQPGAMGIIRNLSTSTDETWLAASMSNPGNLVRKVLPTDSSPYRDVDMNGNPAAISGLYETSILPGHQDDAMTLHDYSGAHFRMSGNGQMNLTIYGIDHVRSVIPLASPYTLSQTPGMEVLLRWFLRSEQETIQFGTNAIDAYLVMALIRAYYTNSFPQR